MASQTPNIGLQLYEDKDPANLTDQYNASMNTLDTMLPGISGNSSQAIARLNALGITDTGTAETSKTAWDGAADLSKTNEEDIAGIDANLNALHANTTTDAGNLYDLIMANRRPTEIVIIGDSITAGQGLDNPATQAYPYYLGRSLGLNTHIYAQSGAGFVNASAIAPYNTLLTLSQQAVNDDTYDHNMVGIVLLMGGINDGYDQADQARNNAINALNSLHASFPNAQVYLGVCPTCGLSRQANKTLYAGIPTASQNIDRLTDVATDMTWSVHIIDAWRLLWAKPQMTTDNLHPNQVGHRYLASQLITAINGGTPNCSNSTYHALWTTGSIRNITSADQIPDSERYAWVKSHFISSRRTYPNIYSMDGRSLIYKSTFSMQISFHSDGTQPDVFYFPISRMPQFMEFYRSQTDWETINYEPLFQCYSFSQNFAVNGNQEQALLIPAYNIKENMIEIAISASVKPADMDITFTLATPTISIPLIGWNQ